MSKILTAEEFLETDKDWNKTTPELMIEFAKLHVEEALTQAEKIAVDFDCEGNYDNSILDCYPLENIK